MTLCGGGLTPLYITCRPSMPLSAFYMYSFWKCLCFLCFDADSIVLIYCPPFFVIDGSSVLPHNLT